MLTIRRLALATTLTTLGVIGVGGLVRATGSGDACPDWPLCFGRVIPPLEYHVLIEYSHRTIGLVAILMLITTAVVALVKRREARGILTPLLIATPSILMQAVLGAIVVHIKDTPSLSWLEPWFVTFHIATAMGLIALLVIITVRAYGMTSSSGIAPGSTVRRLDRWAAASLWATFVLLLAGAYLRGEGAALVFGDWPLMGGELLPRLDGSFGVHFAHRAIALLAGLVVGAYVVRAFRARGRHPAAARFAVTAGALYVVQAVIGGLQVLTRLDAWTVTLHVLFSGLTWAALVASATALRRLPAETLELGPPSARPEPLPISGAQIGVAAASPPGVLTTVGAYVRLTKPRIITLLLITTVPTMALAAAGRPSPALVALTLVGGTLAAASANAFNMVLDRDIDAVMARTKTRPLPKHQVPPARAAIFAGVLAAASLGLMASTVNLTAALLAQSAIAFYVLVYTIGLKRSTPQNIVIGGAAGAVPVLVGWAAVTGTVGAEAWLLFAVIFLWTPPHFWALAMRHERDYAAAGVPMMPVVAGVRSTARQVVAYTALTVGVSIALVPVGGMSLGFLIAAMALGGWFLGYTLVLLRDRTPRAAMAVFRTSITYLALYFVAVGIDAVARA